MTPDLNVLANLGIMVLSGIFMGRLMKHLRLPNVTGYLIAGLLLGPYFLPALGIPFSVLSESFINNMTIIPEAALGFIAFSIGNEFKRSYFRQVGTAPAIIACLESLFAVVFVAGMMILTGYSVPFSLVLGSIAAATAPASTIMVINQYRARGPVTKTLLSVVALDDAIALVLFSVCMAAAQSIKGGAANLAWAIFRPVLEIFGALALGILLGILMLIPMRRFHKHGNRLALVCGFLFLGIGLADRFGLSSLMLCMGMGAAVANLSREANSILDVAESITAPIYILFFVASGASLQVKMLRKIGLIGGIYIVFRFVGKWFGSWLGGRIGHAGRNVSHYLGPCLLPQAGVAIGLTLVAGNVVPKYAAQIRAVVLAGTLVYELAGPAVTKMSLVRAGEIRSS